MTTDPIELVFDLTAQDQARAKSYLLDQRFMKRDGLIERLWRPPWFWLVGVPCTLALLPWLIGVLDHFRQGVLPKDFGLMSVLGLALALFFLGYEAKLILVWLRKQLGLDAQTGPNRKGARPCRHRITVRDDSLVVETETCRTTYQWPAITAIEENDRTLLLTLTPYTAIVVPKSAFASEALEQSFRGFVGQRIVAAA